MFIASFKLKTAIQKALVTIQDFQDFPRVHPARELKRIALEESVRDAQKSIRRSVGVESAREVLTLALQEVSIAGHYLEFGVFKGGTIRFIASLAGPSKTVHGFDSFEGLKEAWSGDPGRFDAHGKLPTVPPNVTLYKGLFSDTLPTWLESHPGPVSFLHIDCDLYESTRCVFEQLHDRIVPGTIIVFDEYFNYPNWQDHEYLAFQQFVQSNGVRYEYLAYARFQVAVRIQEVGRSAEVTTIERLQLNDLNAVVSESRRQL